ncbi:MAG: alkaline phosphatase family protein, partial [Pseudomonadota bacterium]
DEAPTGSGGFTTTRRVVLMALLAGITGSQASCSKAKSTPKEVKTLEGTPGLIILGIDGMDYNLTRRYMREGKLPNFKKLADAQEFRALETTFPPQSPVAWASFMTGLHPEGHGIYDFVHRDPKDISPYLSTSKAETPDCTIVLGSLALPYCEAQILSLRRGVPFWESLEGDSIGATIYKMPANFPPEEQWAQKTLSGMGTPDIMGTYGTFQALTNDPQFVGKTPSGGIIHEVKFAGQLAQTQIHGPPDPYTVGNPVMPISSPREFATELAQDAGRYYTQGMPEDTKALAANVLSDSEFLQQADSIFQERMRLLDHALEDYDGGVMFFYFSSLDQLCHVFWRTLDVPEGHELYEHRNTIPDIYQEMDRMLGQVLERVPEGTEVLVVSDHGFSPYTYKVHLNTWLYEQGYLVLREDEMGITGLRGSRFTGDT